ncbi:MAG: hypothetical protein HBSAPP02_15250 [Phycisphaerae bacterium]|nr:MAG: PEP-CTERM sorting domain-containing protein [Planctomycetia bacterium]GJQ26493.1 MAG: hypothetical protein HBSAPP02_15250 [Phycisphaerae bacterium]
MRCVLLFVSAALFAATPALGQLIVGNDQSGTATIYNVNPTTGVATPIYSGTGPDAKPWGMAYDAATNTLYWNNGSTLYKSPFGPVLTPTNVGTMMFNAATINFVGLGFNNGKLYGTRNIATEAVYEIDPGTLVASQVYVYPSAYDFGGLDFDLTDGKLYGLSDTAPSPNTPGLYHIDYLGFTQSQLAGYPAGETDIDGLAVHAGIAYYVTDGPNTTQPNFYKYDVNTGNLLGTLPSPFTGSGTFSAATWAPEPASLALMALAGMGLIRRRR